MGTKKKALVLSATVILFQAAIVAALYLSGVVTDVMRLFVISTLIAPMTLLGNDIRRMSLSPQMAIGLFFEVLLGSLAIWSSRTDESEPPFVAMVAGLFLAVAILGSSLDFEAERRRDEGKEGVLPFFAILAVPQVVIATVALLYILRP